MPGVTGPVYVPDEVTSSSSGGFWGADGFTLDDASSIFDTIGTGLGWFGIGGTPEPATAAPAGTPGTYSTPASNTWVWWALGGVLVLVAAIYFIRKGKK